MRSALLFLITATASLAQPAANSIFWQKTNLNAPNSPLYSAPPESNPSVFGMDAAGVIKSFPVGPGLEIEDGQLVATGGTWESITGKPTTLDGYGITDASPIAGSSSITTVGTIGNGTWNATAIALGKIAQGGATSNQVLSWNGSTWAPATISTGITIGSTAITSGTNKRVFYDANGVVGETAAITVDTDRITLGDASHNVYFTGPFGSNAWSQGGDTTWKLDAPIRTGGGYVAIDAGGSNVSTIHNGSALFQIHIGGSSSGGSANLFSVRNTWSSATIFEAFTIDWQTTANLARVGTLKGADGGTARDWALVHGGTEQARVTSSGLTVSGTGGLTVNNSAPVLTLQGADRAGILSTSIFGNGVRTNSTLEVQGIIVYTSNNGVQRHYYLERDDAVTDNALQLGLDSGTPADQLIKSADGSGTNIGGADLALAAGRGTGSAASGSILFQTHASGSSGTTPGTLTTRMMITDLGVAIGSDTPIIAVRSDLAQLDFQDLDPGEAEELTFTVAGALVGDDVAPGWPASDGTTTVLYNMRVTAADTITVRAVNAGTVNQDPQESFFRATVIRH